MIKKTLLSISIIFVMLGFCFQNFAVKENVEKGEETIISEVSGDQSEQSDEERELIDQINKSIDDYKIATDENGQNKIKLKLKDMFRIKEQEIRQKIRTTYKNNTGLDITQDQENEIFNKIVKEAEKVLTDEAYKKYELALDEIKKEIKTGYSSKEWLNKALTDGVDVTIDKLASSALKPLLEKYMNLSADSKTWDDIVKELLNNNGNNLSKTVETIISEDNIDDTIVNKAKEIINKDLSGLVDNYMEQGKEKLKEKLGGGILGDSLAEMLSNYISDLISPGVNKLFGRAKGEIDKRFPGSLSDADMEDIKKQLNLEKYITGVKDEKEIWNEIEKQTKKKLEDKFKSFGDKMLLNLAEQAGNFAGAFAENLVSKLTDKIDQLGEKLGRFGGAIISSLTNQIKNWIGENIKDAVTSFFKKAFFGEGEKFVWQGLKLDWGAILEDFLGEVLGDERLKEALKVAVDIVKRINDIGEIKGGVLSSQPLSFELYSPLYFAFCVQGGTLLPAHNFSDALSAVKSHDKGIPMVPPETFMVIEDGILIFTDGKNDVSLYPPFVKPRKYNVPGPQSPSTPRFFMTFENTSNTTAIYRYSGNNYIGGPLTRLCESAYILAEMQRNLSADSYVQKALSWTTINKGTGAAPADPDAIALRAEAAEYGLFRDQIAVESFGTGIYSKVIKDLTTDAVAMYNRTSDTDRFTEEVPAGTYVLGPFKVHYIRAFSHELPLRQKTEFGFIDDMKIYDQNGEEIPNDYWSIIYSDDSKKSDMLYDEGRLFPYPDEEFYIELSNYEGNTIQAVKTIKIKYEEMQAYAQYSEYTGNYMHCVWTEQPTIVMIHYGSHGVIRSTDWINNYIPAMTSMPAQNLISVNVAAKLYLEWEQVIELEYNGTDATGASKITTTSHTKLSGAKRVSLAFGGLNNSEVLDSLNDLGEKLWEGKDPYGSTGSNLLDALSAVYDIYRDPDEETPLLTALSEVLGIYGKTDWQKYVDALKMLTNPPKNMSAFQVISTIVGMFDKSGKGSQIAETVELIEDIQNIDIEEIPEIVIDNIPDIPGLDEINLGELIDIIRENPEKLDDILALIPEEYREDYSAYLDNYEDYIEQAYENKMAELIEKITQEFLPEEYEEISDIIEEVVIDNELYTFDEKEAAIQKAVELLNNNNLGDIEDKYKDQIKQKQEEIDTASKKGDWTEYWKLQGELDDLMNKYTTERDKIIEGLLQDISKETNDQLVAEAVEKMLTATQNSDIGYNYIKLLDKIYKLKNSTEPTLQELVDIFNLINEGGEITDVTLDKFNYRLLENYLINIDSNLSNEIADIASKIILQRDQKDENILDSHEIIIEEILTDAGFEKQTINDITDEIRQIKTDDSVSEDTIIKKVETIIDQHSNELDSEIKEAYGEDTEESYLAKIDVNYGKKEKETLVKPEIEKVKDLVDAEIKQMYEDKQTERKRALPGNNSSSTVDNTDQGRINQTIGTSGTKDDKGNLLFDVYKNETSQYLTTIENLISAVTNMTNDEIKDMNNNAKGSDSLEEIIKIYETHKKGTRPDVDINDANSDPDERAFAETVPYDKNDPNKIGVLNDDTVYMEYSDKFKISDDARPQNIYWGNNDEMGLTIAFGGVVWKDAHYGQEKDYDGIRGANANGNLELGIEGVKVYLWDMRTNQEAFRWSDRHTPSKEPAETYTDEGGYYLIDRVPVGRYDVRFEYDGQTYKTTKFLSSYDDNSKTTNYNTNENINIVDYVNDPDQEKYRNSSLATENPYERQAFNDKFGTITYNASNGESLADDYITTNDGESKLVTTETKVINGKTVKNVVKDKFKMTASTDNYGLTYPIDDNITLENHDMELIINGNKVTFYSEGEYMYHINMGLVERSKADAAVTQDVLKAVTTVNQKMETYNYYERGILGIYDAKQKQKTNYINIRDFKEGTSKANYLLELYKADYEFRYTDYKKNSLNQYDKNDSNFTKEITKIQNAIKEKGGEELNQKVYVTYKVTLKNQSILQKMAINELIYDYDSKYTLVGKDKIIQIQNENGEPSPTRVARAPFFVKGNNEYIKLDNIIKKGHQQISIDFSDYLLSAGETMDLYLTFEANVRNIKSNNINMENYVEITSYSTYNYNATSKNDPKEGLIDKDSNPNNRSKNAYEDDTDKAPILAIGLYEKNNNHNGRTIDGFVWDDNRNKVLDSKQVVGDGIRQKGEDLINGVKVQLIEKIVDPTTKEEYEYVWKEMYTGEDNIRSVKFGDGSNVDDKTTISGSTTLGKPETGEYIFNNFVAGNYIVRFIYGDTEKTYLPKDAGGRNKGQNKVSYNGQDYKATRYQNGTNYNKKWYDLGNSTQNNRLMSDAKDNSYRRAEVINYSRTIQNDKAEILASFDNTKQKITNNVNTNYKNSFKDSRNYYNTDKHKALRDATWMFADTAQINVQGEYNTTESNGLKNTTYRIRNIDFGLEQRPETRIELKKQIKRITIKNGKEVVIDYSPDKGEVKGLQNIPTKKNPVYDIVYKRRTKTYTYNQGLININMDDEILRSDIEIEYEITLENNSEIDYIGREFEEFIVNNLGEFSKNDREFRKKVEALKIGEAYCNGISDYKKDKIVTTTVNKVIDYVDNNLVFRKDSSKDWDLVENIEDFQTEKDKKKIGQNNELLSEGVNISNKQSNEEVLKFMQGNKKDGETIKNRYLNKDLVLNQTVPGKDESAHITQVIVSKALDNTALEAGQKATIELTLVKSATANSANKNNNTFSYRNVAEILQLTNTVGRRDMDAIPGNQDPDVDGTRKIVPYEYDSDFTEVITITPPTGNNKAKYFVLGAIVLIILGSGIILIKRKVMDKKHF